MVRNTSRVYLPLGLMAFLCPTPWDARLEAGRRAQQRPPARLGTGLE
jgi:hypothetical protein